MLFTTGTQYNNGRITRGTFGTDQFNYTYLANSHLISQVTTCGGAAKKVFAYEANRDLPTEIAFKLSNNTLIAKRNYEFDALGRVSARTQTRGNATAREDAFGYNDRSEVISATLGTDAYGYAFDNIGNRITAEELTDEIAYTSNDLNQYTAIEKNSSTPFVPTFDDDGNQLTVQTATGVWTVTYNAENRPITFTKDTTVIECKYDANGRRFEKKVTDNNIVTFWQRYVYKGYVQIASFNVTLETVDEVETKVYTLATTTYWDATEPTATRPLAFTDYTSGTPTTYYYTHDLTKNVCEILSRNGSTVSVVTEYDYTPFGAVTASNTNTANTFIFSSEVLDPETALVYYNFRHYNPADGRWINRDPIGEDGGRNLYSLLFNSLIKNCDLLGLAWYDPFSWEWSSFFEKIGDGFIDIVKPVGKFTATASVCAIKYTYEYAIYQPSSFLFGRNMGEFWWSTIWGPWGRGPTGGIMPNELANGMWDIHDNLPPNSAANGMHSWHTGSNAYLIQEMGVLSGPIILLGGLIHETPLDYKSFCAENEFQGTVNHTLDSLTDLLANLLGVALGTFGVCPKTAAVIGNWIPVSIASLSLS